MRPLLAALLTTPSLVHATAWSGETSLLSSAFFTQLTLGLLIVIAFAIALSWMLRRYALPRAGVIRVIGGLPLGTRERLLLIEVGEVRLLIGVTAQHIQTLHTFTTPNVTPLPAPFEASHEVPPP